MRDTLEICQVGETSQIGLVVGNGDCGHFWKFWPSGFLGPRLFFLGVLVVLDVEWKLLTHAGCPLLCRFKLSKVSQNFLTLFDKRITLAFLHIGKPRRRIASIIRVIIIVMQMLPILSPKLPRIEAIVFFIDLNNANMGLVQVRGVHGFLACLQMEVCVLGHRGMC